jgi:hypothetical protein
MSKPEKPMSTTDNSRRVQQLLEMYINARAAFLVFGSAMYSTQAEATRNHIEGLGASPSPAFCGMQAEIRAGRLRTWVARQEAGE